jgi:4-hydroxy-L-threonine phosphate dehydrogenase PdxA
VTDESVGRDLLPALAVPMGEPAGTGRTGAADPSSLIAALRMARQMAINRSAQGAA